MSDRQRLFFALNPSEEDRQNLYRMARTIADETGGRVTPRRNLHLTLRFLGSTDGAMQACIESVAESIRLQPFAVDFNALKRTRSMVWAVAPSPPALLSLVQGLKAMDSACGLPAADHPFSAHITLVRDAKQIPAELPALPTPVHCHFEEFSLMRSQTLPEGSQYSIVRSWRLQ